MLVVGELINGSRKAISQAITQRDAQTIRKVAREQYQAGAQLLDVNAGTSPDQEIDDLLWLLDVILGELDVPLCIDSPNVYAMEAGLDRAGDRAVMVNSITAQKSRLESFLPLIEAHQSQVVALCMDEGGVPQQAQERYEIAARLVKKLASRGIAPEKIFLDPIVCPVSVDYHAAQVARETLRLIKKHLPQAKTICGLSNISFGLPSRRLLNHNFLSLMLAEGLDAAIIDPTDDALMANLTATQTLMGRDEHCLGYITAHREGKLT